MRIWNVRSFVRCPLCGEEMEMTSGTWYYSYPAHVVGLECYECHLVISEYSGYNPDDTRQERYFTMINRLRERAINSGCKEMEGYLG